MPVEEILAGIDDLYKAGAFRRLGLSNLNTDDVEEIVCISKERGYLLPSIYQVNYSAVARRVESELFPTLRKYGISVYVYSPCVGGFLAKTPEGITNGTGRWHPEDYLGKIYHSMYAKPSIIEGLTTWNKIAEDAAICSAVGAAVSGRNIIASNRLVSRQMVPRGWCVRDNRAEARGGN